MLPCCVCEPRELDQYLWRRRSKGSGGEAEEELKGPGQKSCVGKEKEKTKEAGYSLRLHKETELEIQVGTQLRDWQDWEPGTAGRAQAGRGSTDEGAQG